MSVTEVSESMILNKFMVYMYILLQYTFYIAIGMDMDSE